MPNLTPAQRSLWEQRIQRCQAHQQRKADAWTRALQLYAMSYWRDQGFTGTLESGVIPVNYITTFVNTLVASIFARHPTRVITPRNAQRYADFARLMTQVLTRQDEEWHTKDTYLRVLTDAVIFSVGWVEAGYLSPDRTQAIPDPQPVQQGLVASMKTMLTQLLGTAKPAPPLATEGELDERLRLGELYLLRRHPQDILVPPGYDEYWTLPYLIRQERLAVEDFYNNPRYTNQELAAHRKYPTARQQTGLVGPEYLFADPTLAPRNDEEQVVLYHVQDRRSQTWFTLAEGSGVFHAGPEMWPHYAEGFSYHPLQFNYVPALGVEANFYGFSDVEPLIAQVIEKSNIRSQASEHRQRASMVVFVQKGSLTETELANYAEANTAVEIVPVSAIGQLQVSPPISVPPALFQMEGMCDTDLERESGLGLLIADLKRSGDINRSSIAALAQASGNLKTAFKVDRLEAFFKRVDRYRAGLCWQFLTRMDVGELLGRLPDAQEWPDLPPDPSLARLRVRKELEFTIKAGSTKPFTENILKRNQLNQTAVQLGTLSPSLWKLIEHDWWQMMAREFDEPDLEEAILKSLNTQEQQIIQQEEALLAQNLPAIVRPTDNHVLHNSFHAQANQRAPTPARDQHMLQHEEYLKSGSAGKQGAAQAAAGPSSAEVNQQGAAGSSDLMGQSMNLREGTGSAPVGA